MPGSSATDASTFEPYTLALHRGGLYLIGKSHRGNHIVTLAVERMRSAKRLTEHFEYPKSYSPEKQTEGAFGIIEGPETHVELLVMNPETLAYLKSRRIHPTQRFRTRGDGKTVLSMTVRGTEELKNWILGFGPFLQVLKPRELREEMADLLRQAAALYRGFLA
jgi:predicted DNA-binding transcriptional regulator YafY